jgi:hypothetical protein
VKIILKNKKEKRTSKTNKELHSSPNWANQRARGSKKSAKSALNPGIILIGRACACFRTTAPLRNPQL